MAAGPAAKAKHKAAQRAAIDDQSWRERAACVEKKVPPEVFFDDELVDYACSICSGCEVQRQCGLYASGMRMPDGVWGGRPRGVQGRYNGKAAA